MRTPDRKKRQIAATAVVAGVIAVGGITVAASWAAVAATSGKPTAAHLANMPGMATAPGMHKTVYSFSTLDNQNDPTFNQLLGINNEGAIAGYFGSGTQGHPNQGYLLSPPYTQGNYQSENFTNSVQTQVTGLNDKGVTVGFFSTQNNATQNNNNFGWYASGGQFHEVNFPTGTPASPPVDQLLGVNDHDIAVGFFTNASGLNRGYTYNINTKRFNRVLIPGVPGLGPSLTATAINNHDDVAGFYTAKNGATDAFLAMDHGRFLTLNFPHASATQALGVNDSDEVVGVYTDGTGKNATMHGFTWTQGGGFATVDDPNGVGTTTINGVNDQGDLVGFYVDGQGNTHGLLATPARTTTLHLTLNPMPQASVTLGRDGADDITATVSAFGLTPGSSHLAELVNGNGGIVAQLSDLTANGVGQAQATLDSTFNGTLAPGVRFEILNGTQGDPVSVEPIAETSPIVTGVSTYALFASEVDQNGFDWGIPFGHATVTYNPAAETISVTVNASGFTPGMHAAHIHIGSCQSQGPVQYMLMDFTANGNGQIVNETRTVTGVTSPIPASGWYLNVHQGTSDDILSNGQPTIFFRPLACANI
jgi:Cu/Zn superoxide dismutase